MWPCVGGAVEGEAVERHRHERGVSGDVAEAGAREPPRAFQLEPADLGVLRPGRARLADAADLLRVLVGLSVGRRGIRRVRNLCQELVALGLGRRKLGLGGAQLVLDPGELRELLGRRLALQLQLRP